jgi:hypothetical protein
MGSPYLQAKWLTVYLSTVNKSLILWMSLMSVSCLPAMADLLDLDEHLDAENEPYRKLPWIRLLGDYGLTLHIGSIDTGITEAGKKYLNQTLMGTNAFLEATVYPWPRGGLGGFYSHYASNDKTTNIRFRPNTPIYSFYQNQNEFTAYGPVFTSRLRLAQTLLYGGVGAGFLKWRGTVIADNQRFDLAADTYTVLFEAGLDLVIVRAFALGISGRLFLASVRKFTVNGVQVQNSTQGNTVYYTSLNRLEAALGIRFGI